MGLFQSFQQVFVTNSPALLAQGLTVDSLAVGQIGLLDAKTYKATTTPTYAKNKALYAVWGTPDVNLGDFGGAPNENEYSKIIKGKLVKHFRAKRAKRGQTPLYTVGWSGDVSDTDSLSAKTGESKNLFIKLTGTIIDRLYDRQGFIKQFVTTPACVDDCTDTCTDVVCNDMAIDLANQINADKDLRKFIRAKALLSCTPEVVETTCYKFILNVCDTGDARSLGAVQAQYPNDRVTFLSRAGAISSYEIVRNANTLPAAFSNAPVVVPDCPSCALGTLVPEAKVFEVINTCGSGIPVLPGQISGTKISSNPQFDVWIVLTSIGQDTQAVIDNAIADGCEIATFIGVRRNICQLAAVTVVWVANGTLKKQEKDYRITLADTICGSNRLAELQAAYPTLVVTVVDAGGSCVHTYETTTVSDCYETGCGISSIVFHKPAMFEGAEWKEVVVAPEDVTDCLCGIQIETAFFNRTTNECTFDSFPYENDIVHVQISNRNPDFNGDPCEGEWVVKQIRQVQFPQGHGAYVQRLEKESKQYDQRFRNTDAVVREVQGYSLQADASKFYDQYVLEYDTKWFTSGGWAEQYSQAISLNFFVPEGTGSAIETALNSYVTSAGIEEDGAAI